MTTKINANVGTITPSTHNIPLGDDISITLEGKLPLNLDGLKLTVPINYTRDISADMLETLLIDNGPYDVALGIISKRLKIISQPISSAPKDCIDLCLRQGSIQNRVGSYKKYVDVCIKAYIDTKDENYATLAKTKYTEGKNSKGVDYYWKETFDPKYIRFSIIEKLANIGTSDEFWNKELKESCMRIPALGLKHYDAVMAYMQELIEKYINTQSIVTNNQPSTANNSGE